MSHPQSVTTGACACAISQLPHVSDPGLWDFVGCSLSRIGIHPLLGGGELGTAARDNIISGNRRCRCKGTHRSMGRHATNDAPIVDGNKMLLDFNPTTLPLLATRKQHYAPIF